MTDKNKAIMAVYAVMGVIVGFMAYRNYVKSVQESIFYALVCLVVAILICVEISKSTYNSIAGSFVVLVLILIFMKPASWAVTWIVCAINACFSIAIIILKTIGKFFMMLF